jgi:hypothetical protein
MVKRRDATGRDAPTEMVKRRDATGRDATGRDATGRDARTRMVKRRLTVGEPEDKSKDRVLSMAVSRNDREETKLNGGTKKRDANQKFRGRNWTPLGSGTRTLPRIST